MFCNPNISYKGDLWCFHHVGMKICFYTEYLCLTGQKETYWEKVTELQMIAQFINFYR